MVKSYFASENNYGLTLVDFMTNDISGLLLLLIPFGIGAAIIIIAFNKKRYIIGLFLGVMAIIIIYILFLLSNLQSNSLQKVADFS